MIKRRRHTTLLSLGMVALLLGHSTAWAQHGHTIAITSDANGSGELQLGWDFEGLPIARTSSALGGVFTNNVPGLNDGTGDGSTTFPLTDGTNVDVELTAIDEGIRWIFTNGTLEVPGDTALLGTMPSLHNHATFEINGTDDEEFREGRISFRVFESSVVPKGYSASEVRTLRVTNGHLPPLGEGESKKANESLLKCQKEVDVAGRDFLRDTHELISDCVFAALDHAMLGSKAKHAVKKCNLDHDDSKSLVGKIAAEKQKAASGVAKKCSALSTSSLPYTESQIYTHLGMAECRAEEMVGAAHNNAVETIGEVLEEAGVGDHHDVQHAFPCMKASIEEE